VPDGPRSPLLKLHGLTAVQVSQIFISDCGDELPPRLRSCVDLVRQCHQSLPHVIYNDASLRQLIAERFDKEVLWAYDKLLPYPYRADLGRYCILYALGGWYFDISVQLLTGISVGPSVESLAYRDIGINTSTCWGCWNAVLYSRKGNQVFETAIRQVVENCRNEYYGSSGLCPTGTNLLGAAFARHGSNPNAVFGDLLEITPLRARRNLAFVLPDGTIHGFAKPVGSTLADMGARGTNTFGPMWNARNVYRKGA